MSAKELDRILEQWLAWAMARQVVQTVLVYSLRDGTSEIFSGWTSPHPDHSLEMQFRIQRGSNWMHIEQRFGDGRGHRTRWRSAARFGNRLGNGTLLADTFPRHADAIRLVDWRDAMS